MHFKVTNYKVHCQTANYKDVIHKYFHANNIGLECFRATNSVC